MIFFYALSFFSGFFETGPLMMTLASGLGSGAASATAQALACVLCYQIGNLAPRPMALSKSAITASGLLGFFCFVSTLLPLPYAVVLAARLLGTAFISGCIQSARAVAKSNASKLLKRSARIAGFAAGFFCVPLLAHAVAALVVIFSLTALSRVPATKSRLVFPRLNTLNAVMIFHQMHYFVYCYAAFIIAFGLGGNSGGDACGRAAAVIAFVASWIIYVLSPFVYKRVKDLRKAFFFGHSLLVIVLAAAFFAPSMPVKIILYLLTGVGGTTEFCIGGLAKKWGLYSENAQGFAENTGHVLGVVFCLLLFVFLANLWISLLFAALFALAAIACMAKTIVTVDKEKI